MENYTTSGSISQEKSYSAYTLARKQFNQEPEINSFKKVDYLEVTMSEMSSYSMKSKETFKSEGNVQITFKTFTIMDYSTILPTKINVSSKDACNLTVNWLLDEYIKKQSQSKNVRFDSGNLVCLKTRTSQIQYDYVLTQPDACLSLFPDEIVLETYHSHPISSVVDFSSFEILGLVGQGGYGIVLAARKKDTGNIYAMKVICKSKFQMNQSEVYIFGEKNILMELAHPYVVRLILEDKSGVHFPVKQVHFLRDGPPHRR